MPKPVVDVFEPVQVAEEHSYRATRAPGAGQRQPDVVVEQPPIGQPGQRVVQRPKRQLLLRMAAFGDVPDVGHDAVDRGCVHAVGVDGLHPAPLS
jgi:hypothetical protein